VVALGLLFTPMGFGDLTEMSDAQINEFAQELMNRQVEHSAP